MSNARQSNAQLEAMSFYDWYESRDGQCASEAEKRRRAAAFVKHVVMGMYYQDRAVGQRAAVERRRAYRANLKLFNDCITNGWPLPSLPRPQNHSPTVALDPALLESI